MAIYKMTEKEKIYYELSEIYLSAYQDNIGHNFKIMQAMGVVVEMESDLIIFEKSKGKTEKSIYQQHRIDIIKSAIDSFTVSTERNLQFNMVMGRLNKDNDLKSLKISQLEDEISKLNKQLEGI